ncbi:GNAT family N-acetyltransferase [Bacillus rhizoplanae]|uniref:GNAT family N-acetyltransferase n=1 Tax=Bacillus rhizoplanae TaxID=2880966 RepID=UPI003D232C19
MQIQNKCSQEDSDFIRKQLVAFNNSQVSGSEKSLVKDICLTLKNDNEEIVAGLTGVIFWQCLHVNILWVSDSLRHKGYGSRLLLEAERIAKENHCNLIKLDTFSFQAPEFYKKHGYEVYGVIEDFPKGHTHYYLQKRLIV